jgi:PAS domain S-box-containing protein
MTAPLMRILLVEDNRSDAMLLQEMLLGTAGSVFRLILADRMEKALAFLSNDTFAAILLDLTLPDSNGLATIEQIRKAARDTPTIILTGVEDEELAIRAIQHGAQDYLVKGTANGKAIAKAIRFAIDRKKTDEQLRRAEAAYTSAKASVDTVNAMFTGVALADMSGRIISVNPAFEQVTGYGNAELSGTDAEVALRRIVCPEDLLAALEVLLHALGGKPADSIAVTIVAKNGSRIPLIASVSHIRDAGGQPSAMVLTISDISELREAEEKLRRSQTTLAEAQRVAHIGNWDWDINGNRMDWSDEVYRIFGLTPETFGGTHEAFLKSLHRDDRQQVDTAIELALQGKQSFDIDHRIVLPGGMGKMVHEQGEVFRDETGKPVRMLGTVQDVTEQKKVERQNQVVTTLLAMFAKKTTRKEYLDAVTRVVHQWSGCRCIGVRVRNDKGDIPYESHLGFSDEFVKSESFLTIGKHQCACTRIIGRKPEPQDLQHLTQAGSFQCDNTAEFLKSLTEREKERFRGVCFKIGFSSVAIVPVRYREVVIGAIHFADERERMISAEMVAFAEANLSPMIGEAIHRFDVEQSLRLAGAYNRSLFEASPDPLITISKQGKITDANEAAEKVTGISRDELVGTDFSGYFTDPAMARAGYQRIFEEGMVRDYALDIRHRDGRITPVLYNASVYRDEDGNIAGVLAAARDITERRKAQRDLYIYQSELRALSSELTLAEERARRQLAIALHDTVGQSLALCKIKLGVLSQSVKEKEQKTALAEVREMFEAAIRQTRTLSFELSPPILYELGLSPALEWMGEEFGKRHELLIHFEEIGEKRAVSESVSVLFFQSARELLTNIAKHADATTVHITLKTTRGRIVMSVTDNGKGMGQNGPGAAPGEKNSLGLFSIRERMKHIGGTFDIQSGRGHGTIATLSAPMPDEKENPAAGTGG